MNTLSNSKNVLLQLDVANQRTFFLETQLLKLQDENISLKIQLQSFKRQQSRNFATQQIMKFDDFCIKIKNLVAQIDVQESNLQNLERELESHKEQFRGGAMLQEEISGINQLIQHSINVVGQNVIQVPRVQFSEKLFDFSCQDVTVVTQNFGIQTDIIEQINKTDTSLDQLSLIQLLRMKIDVLDGQVRSNQFQKDFLPDFIRLNCKIQTLHDKLESIKQQPKLKLNVYESLEESILSYLNNLKTSQK